MAVSWKWKVESKEFELVIKGGATGVRFFERNNKHQRSIFVLRDELDWLARKGKELVAVENSEVFWDPSRAAYPRIIAQKCSNRHGNFLLLEEFDGRSKCGSIRIPEGRYGEGWERFLVELHRANSSLRGVRENPVCKKVAVKRSYAEVVGLSKAEDNLFYKRKETDIPARTGTGDKQKVLRRPAFHGTEKEEKKLPEPACRCLIPATRLSPMELSNPVKSGKKPLEGRLESEKEEKSSVDARLELQIIKESLTKVRGEVDAGLARLDAVIETLESSGPRLGLVEMKEMGRDKEKAEDCSWSNGVKPRKKNTKKEQAGFAGPKPGRKPVTGLRHKDTSQAFSGLRSVQVGESSMARESVPTGMLRPASSSILGAYEWVRKAVQTAPAVGSADVGSSPTTTSEPEIGISVAAQDLREVVGPIQTMPTVMGGNHGGPGKPGATPARQFKSSGSIGDLASGLAGAEQTENSLVKVQGYTQTAPAELFGNLSDLGESGDTPASQLKSPGPSGESSNNLAGAELTENDFLKVQGGGIMVEMPGCRGAGFHGAGQMEVTQTAPASLSGLDSAGQGCCVVGFSTQLEPAVKPGCRSDGVLDAGQMEESQIAPASLSGLDLAGQRCCVMGDPPQLVLAVAPGSRVLGFRGVGLPEEFQMTQPDVPGSSLTTQGFFEAGHPEVCLTESEGTEWDAFSEEASLMGEEGSMLVPWQSGNLILDSGGVGSNAEEEPIPLEICLGRFGGERVAALPRLADSHGMELVPFVDGKPISQDWKLAMEIGDSVGVRGVDKEMELIMVFRNIVGVSCDGHVERLKAAFAPILAGKKKKTKKNRGGGQVGRKGTREILNLFTSVNYEGGNGSVTRSRGKGRGNRLDS
jgi:hypothetical protein